MGVYAETKHDAYNLKFKKHEVFADKLVVVDESDIPVLWLSEKTGKVSFGGKYFHLYKEQRLIEAMKNLSAVVYDFVHGENDEHVDYVRSFQKALEFADQVEYDFYDGSNSLRFYEIDEPYYALIKAKDEEEAIQEYVEVVADDAEDQPLSEEIKLVDREYALAKHCQSKNEDGSISPFNEKLEEFNKKKLAF